MVLNVLSDNEILNYAVQNGIIDLNTIQTQIEMNERKRYLEMQKYDIWQGKNELWYTYLPDEKKGRRLIKRKSRKEIENAVIEYFKSNDEIKKEKEYINKLTLKSIFPEWIRYKQIHTNSSSYMKRITADWCKFYESETELINMPLKKMTKLYLDNWAHEMIKKYNLTKKAYYNMSVIIRQILDYAIEIGCLEDNEFRKVKINTKMFVKTKKKKSNTQVYTLKEEEDLVNDMIRRFNRNPKSTSPLAVMLLFETGLRIGEVCAIQEDDIEGRYLHVQRQEIREFEYVDDFHMKFVGFKIVEYAKTDDGFRDVYLTDVALKIIDIALMVNKNNKEYNPEKFIFFKDGANINHYSVQSMILRGCEKIDIVLKTSHKMRKTYISTLIDAGLNIDEIRRMVGHADERTTFSCYCFNRLTEDETEKKIENALSKKKVINEVIKGNQKIIEFPKMKNPESLVKSGISG